MSTQRFCSLCQSLMVKTTATTGGIVFICRCARIETGTALDTLMFEETFGLAENQAGHDVLIENAPYDLARNIVMVGCPKCALPFMTLISVGVNETTMYTCDCGYRNTRTAHMELIAAQK